MAVRQATVSIALTTLNADAYLRQAINSCLKQTYETIELLIVDGGSTDRTLEIVASYNDPRIRLIHQPHNAGKLPGAINLGLAHAQGEYLTWMQADCYYAPDAIARMVAVLEQHPDAAQVYADFYEVDEWGNITDIKRLPSPEEFLSSLGDPAGVCFLIRRNVRKAIGPHDETTHPCHDYDYRMRIAMRFPSYHIAEPLFSWRYHRHSLTGRTTVTDLARRDIDIRRRLGLDSRIQSWQHLGEIEIGLAFEYYQKGLYTRVPQQVLRALAKDARYLTNIGVWSIFGRSVARTVVSRMVRSVDFERMT